MFSAKGLDGQRVDSAILRLTSMLNYLKPELLFYCRLVVEGEVVSVYHTLENSRVYHEKDVDSVEFGLEVRLFAECSLFSADRLAQLVEHRTAVRKGRRFKPRPDQHSGSLNN